MARLDELAEGIAKVLKLTAVPEPLQLDLVGEGPAEVAVFVRAIVDASRRLEATVARICLDPELGRGLLKEHGDEYEEVELVADKELANRIEIYRFPGS